jgi:hypothetical protein
MTRQDERTKAKERILGILKTTADYHELEELIENNLDAQTELCKITAKLYRKIKNLLNEIED